MNRVVKRVKRYIFITVLILLLVTVIGGCSDKNTVEEGEVAIKEKINVQLAVYDAMQEVIPDYGTNDNPLTPGYITNAPLNNVTYGNGSTLPIGDYITGGLQSLIYSYSVDSTGLVMATTGPLS